MNQPLWVVKYSLVHFWSITSKVVRYCGRELSLLKYTLYHTLYCHTY